MKKLPIGIYPVITEKFCLNGSSVKTLEKVLKGGAKVVQLREKTYDKGSILKIAKEFRGLTSKYNCFLIINDHIDIALASGADGVHLGQGDIPLKDAIKTSKKLIYGISTHSMKEAMAAIRGGASYINIGPIFPTKTKETGYDALGTAALKKIASKVSIPFSVMGGIKEHNLPDVLSAGAKTAAVVTEITMDTDPEAKTKKLNDIILSWRKK